ncbi:alpha/beta fold hydrolase [Pseudomonas sp. Marseille-QA0892]
MSEALNVVSHYLKAFADGNIDSALGLIHPDAVWHVDGDPAVVTVGIIRGRTAIRDWLLRFPDGFRPLSFSIDHTWAADNEVVVAGRFRHQVMPHASLVDSDFVIRFTLRNGLIARYQIFEDSLLISQARHHASPSRSARINGSLYGWDDVGQGAPVVFLHGLFLDRQFWRETVDGLAASQRCVAFDMPGHGVSEWREGLSLDAIAEDLALWLVEHGASGATLVGHSQGGMIALRLAAKYPDLVGRLVLVNTSARAEDLERLPIWRQRRAALLGDANLRKTVFDEIQRFTTAPGWHDAHPATSRQEQQIMMSHDLAALTQALDAAIFERRDVRGLLRDITVPVTVVSGALDRATPPALGEEIAAGVPRGRATTVEAVGHHLPKEAPVAMINAILGA